MNDALNPSPPAIEVVGFLNATIKLPGNDKFTSRHLGGNLFEISFNPDKKYTEGGDAAIFDTLRALSDSIPKKYKKKYMCREYAAAMKKKMLDNGLTGEFLEVKTGTGFIFSDEFDQIATNGIHQAILKDEMIFDNLRPNGISYSDWIRDLGGEVYTNPPHASISRTLF